MVIIHAALFWMMSGAPTCTGNIFYSVFQCGGCLGDIILEPATRIVLSTVISK